jgi:peptidoglycan hydrolase-like protein with peptidoglycan-binding domain
MKLTILRRGSRGAAVRALQELLHRASLVSGHEHVGLSVTGEFDGATERAVYAAQERLNLVRDGIAGPQTQTALKREAEAVKPGRAEPSKSAMDIPVVPESSYGTPVGEPPNVASLQLLDTARPITEIIVHCTATPEGKHFTVDDVRAWHKARGWSDIGYHYLVYPDGRVMLGRPVGQVGSHVAGHNTGTIGVLLWRRLG